MPQHPDKGFMFDEIDCQTVHVCRRGSAKKPQRSLNGEHLNIPKCPRAEPLTEVQQTELEKKNVGL